MFNKFLIAIVLFAIFNINAMEEKKVKRREITSEYLQQPLLQAIEEFNQTQTTAKEETTEKNLSPVLSDEDSDVISSDESEEDEKTKKESPSVTNRVKQYSKALKRAEAPIPTRKPVQANVLNIPTVPASKEEFHRAPTPKELDKLVETVQNLASDDKKAEICNLSNKQKAAIIAGLLVVTGGIGAAAYTQSKTFKQKVDDMVAYIKENKKAQFILGILAGSAVGTLVLTGCYLGLFARK